MKSRLLARLYQLKKNNYFFWFLLEFLDTNQYLPVKKKKVKLNSSTAAEYNDAKTRQKQMSLSFILFFHSNRLKHTAKNLPDTSERLQNQTLAGSLYRDMENQGSPQACTIPHSFSTHLIRESEFSFTLSLGLKAFKRLSAIYFFSVRCKTGDKQCGGHSHINIKEERKALAVSVVDTVNTDYDSCQQF